MTRETLQRAAVEIEPAPPFDFEATADYATAYRRRNLWEFFEDGVYRRALDLGNCLAVVAVRSQGSREAPRLAVDVAAPRLDDDAVGRAVRQVSWLFQTHVDLAAFYATAEEDAFLAPLTRLHRGLRVAQGVSVFEGLVHAILGQQISGQVARAVRAAVMEAYGEALTVDGVEYRAFPRPEALAAAGVEGLRACKLSWRKAEYIADIAAQETAGAIDLESAYALPDDEVVAMLTALRGVGVWTAHWLLVRTLGRTDGFPHGDLALQRALGEAVNGGVRMTEAEALAYAERWRPWRSYVTTYLFAAIRAEREGRADWRPAAP